jgi:hypothetical protein
MTRESLRRAAFIVTAAELAASASERYRSDQL